MCVFVAVVVFVELFPRYKQQTIESMWAINLQTEIDLDLIVCLLKHICTNMEVSTAIQYVHGLRVCSIGLIRIRRTHPSTTQMT